MHASRANIKIQFLSTEAIFAPATLDQSLYVPAVLLKEPSFTAAD